LTERKMETRSQQPSPSRRLRATLCALETPLLILVGAAIFVLSMPLVVSWNWQVLMPVPYEPVLAKLQLWLVLVGIQVVTWAAGLCLVGRWMVEIARSYRPPAAPVLVGALLPAVALGVASWCVMLRGHVFPPETLARYNITNMKTLAMGGYVVALMAVAGILTIGIVLRQQDFAAKDHSAVATYGRLLSLLNSFLLVAALTLGLGTLGSAAVRDASNQECGDAFMPREYVIMYGAIHSLFLALPYGLVRLRLFQAGVAIRKKLLAAPDYSATGIKAWRESSAALDETLGLSFVGLASLGPGLSVLVPLLTGLLSTMLK